MTASTEPFLSAIDTVRRTSSVPPRRLTPRGGSAYPRPDGQDLRQASEALHVAIERFVRAVVASQAPHAPHALHASQDVYSSMALPPDVPSRRRFHEVCRTIPKATKRGRAWVGFARRLGCRATGRQRCVPRR